jgi:hypothetical protein
VSEGADAAAKAEAEDELVWVAATFLEAFCRFGLPAIFAINELRVLCLAVVNNGYWWKYASSQY